jgi:nicotinamidase-related amidase
MSRLIDPAQLALVLIDVQPGFFPGAAGDLEAVLQRIEHLLPLASSFDVPTLATFEHPVDAKGWFPERLERVYPSDGQRLIKHTFNCCHEPDIRAAIAALDRPQLAVAGAETDVCVLQSVLGLLELGYQVFLLEDCLFTSEPNAEPAIARMRHAGAIPTTYKTLYYELRRSVDRPAPWRAWNEQYAGGGFVAPEELRVAGRG